MSRLAQFLQQQLGSSRLRRFGTEVGEHESAVGSATQTAIPLLIAALARNAQRRDGARSLYGALERDHDGSIFESLDDGRDLSGMGDAILNHILGGQRRDVERHISRQSGLGSDSAARLLSNLAPLVMGALGRERRQQQMSPRGMTNYLRGERRGVERGNPGAQQLMSGFFGRSKGGGKAKLLVALVIAGISMFSYLKSCDVNPTTGETQFVALTTEQEIALGVQSAPQMAQRHGGLYHDARDRDRFSRIGRRIVATTAAGKTPYKYEFHLLADPKVVNAFALPGGQIFMTYALYSRLDTDGKIAGVLGHEIGHVVARHSAQHIAKAKLAQGLQGAAVMATYDPSNPATTKTAAVAAIISKLVTMKFGRDDELESDKLGVRYMAEAGYDPRSMISVMEVLAKAGGGGRQPEFFSTHPNPKNRIEKIKAAIKAVFPKGVPEGLTP